MSDLEAANFFTDDSIHVDPYPYFDHLRRLGPIWQEPHYGVFRKDPVTGMGSGRFGQKAVPLFSVRTSTNPSQ